MTPLEEILDLLDMEIHFYQESSPPEEYAKFCEEHRYIPRNRVMVEELELIYRKVVEIQARGAE